MSRPSVRAVQGWIIVFRVLRPLALFPVFFALVASQACASPTSEDPPIPAAPEPAATATTPPAPPPPPPTDAPTVNVSHDRELRGAWISTVFNGTWPSKTGLAPDVAKAELVALFDGLVDAHANTVFLQVRPESDALYASTIEPWSRFLSGKQGTDPGWDPLAFAVEEGHKRGLEIHAWINPYRGLAGSSVVAASSHITKMLPDRAYGYGSQVWMDPGAPEVRAHILDVVRDIVDRYDVDGIHFDDYFYPYPVDGQAFPDGETFAAYGAAGGNLAKDDWRRSNVDALVRETAELVQKTRADVRFGISPFGIYRPGIPEGITGLDAYATLYCDPIAWMDNGWVDYLVPQLYWPTTKKAQAFDVLVAWWAGLAKNGRSVFAGHDLTKIGAADWPLSEYEKEIDLSRAQRTKGLRGNVFFTAKPLATDTLGVGSALAVGAWKTPVLTPPLATALEAGAGDPPANVVPPPKVEVNALELVVKPDAVLRVRAYAIYRATDAGHELAQLVIPSAVTPAADGTIRIAVTPGHWAVSVVDRRGIESLGVPLDVP